MKIDDIIFNDKSRALLKDDSRFILIAGPTGTGKTFITGLKTYLRIVNSPKGRDTYAIVAESQVTAEKMFVDDSSSFVNIFPNCKYVSGKKPHIKIQTTKGVKRVYLGGYATSRDWHKILGLNLDGIHIEEGTIANDDFIREAFVRANRLATKPFMHVTTNGGVPEQILYTEFFDKAHYDRKWNTNIPDAERLALKETNKNYKYWYWGFDDSVTLTKEDIDALYDLFPVGSFFYNSKILGIRGYSTGLLYANLFTDTVLSQTMPKATWVRFQDLKITNIEECIIGGDVGNSAKTVFTLTAYTYKHQRAIVIDVLEIHMTDTKDYTHIVEEFNEWLFYWYGIFFTAIKQIRLDKSNPLFVKQVRNNIGIKNIAVLSSISDKIKNRVGFKQQLLKQGRLMFSDLDGAKKMVDMLKIVKDNGKGEHIDNNTPEIDYSDSLDYSLEPNINKMALYKFRR